MRVSDQALSQAVLPSLAKATNNTTHQTPPDAGRLRRGVRHRTLTERRRLYLLARLAVKRHYHQPLTLGMLAKALAVSTRQLQRAYARDGTLTFQQAPYAKRLTQPAGGPLVSRLTIPAPTLAVALHRTRLKRGITQESLAFKADIAVSALSQIERGVTDPRWKSITAITGALDLRLCDLEILMQQAVADGTTTVEITARKRRVK